MLPPPRPHPQTLLRERDNLKHPAWIASIFYMYIDIGERIAGKQDGTSLIIDGSPRIAKNANVSHLGSYMKNGQLFSSLVIHISAL